MIYSFDPAIQHWFQMAKHHLTDCETILDLGCGKSRLCQMLGKESTGVDNWEKSGKELHPRFLQNEILSHLLRRKKIYDAVIAMDVIEHLDKMEGSSLINFMQMRARKKVIIYTPNGFIPQGANEGNPLQVHKSGWTADDFKSKGFKVFGALGHKKFNNPFRALTIPFIKNNPEKAISLFAVKDL